MIATEKEMREARVPLQWRDNCAHILIKLNECRHDNFYLPNRCVELRHAYEKCQYEEQDSPCMLCLRYSYKRRQKLYKERENAKKKESQ